MEAVRATALAAHSAAGLLTACRRKGQRNNLGEAARMLRSCEALARAAATQLQMTPNKGSKDEVAPGGMSVNDQAGT